MYGLGHTSGGGLNRGPREENEEDMEQQEIEDHYAALHSVADKITKMIVECPPLFDFLWTAALGEPTAPDGDIALYDCEELSGRMLELFEGETANWPHRVARHTSCDKKLWETGHTLTVDQVANLDGAEWARVSEALMTAHPERSVPCPYCCAPVPTTADAFHQHYQQAWCWDTDD